MKKNYLIPLSILISISLTSCGGGSGKNNTSTPEVKNSTSINLNTTNTNLDLTTGDFNIVGTSTSTSATGETLEIASDEGDIVSLMNGNVLILSGRKYEGDETVDISVESSAVMMVLLQPQFMGTQSTDPKELEKRIKSHSDFQELVNEITKKINNKSYCPLEPMCNPNGNKAAQKIAEEIQIDDLL